MLLKISIGLFVVFGILGFVKPSLWAGLILAGAFAIAHWLVASNPKP